MRFDAKWRWIETLKGTSEDDWVTSSQKRSMLEALRLNPRHEGARRGLTLLGGDGQLSRMLVGPGAPISDTEPDPH